MTKRLLIIPARKNSKRIKDKNIKSFHGKAIISYSIELALKSKLFNKIHISTDNKKIKKISNNFGIELDFMRPKRISDDKTGLMEVYYYVVKKYKNMGMIFDEIWFLSACSPLITSKDLQKASKFFNNNDAETMLSICKFSPQIQRAFYIDKKKMFPVNKKFIKKNTQDIAERYFHTGNFGAFKNEVFTKINKIFDYCGYELPKERSVDIDNIDDWNLALKLFKNK
jgi:N-acylneuraminate cytidylyltransferase